MSNDKYAAEDGWLKLTLPMKSNAPMGEDEIKRFASFGKPDEYEFAVVEQYGSRVKVVYRKKPNNSSTGQEPA